MSSGFFSIFELGCFCFDILTGKVEELDVLSCDLCNVGSHASIVESIVSTLGHVTLGVAITNVVELMCEAQGAICLPSIIDTRVTEDHLPVTNTEMIS